ncbi:DUF86 domain-containing protein [Candidatus Pacearchaeota archaeon]|nr:MAG: DUF86 domain-containing protein [Candidatus Pacearchaeota archaeon]
MKRNRKEDKIDEIEKYLGELESILPSSFEEYKNDFKIKAACERYFEEIVEAVIDLAFLIIKEKLFKIPEEDKQAFDILTQEGIISKKLATKLKDVKGMRNIIAHEYGKLDDELIFESITEELKKDINRFIEDIRKINTK